MKYDPKALRLLNRDRSAFLRLFSGNAPEQKRVLANLAKFCRYGTGCFHPDPRIHAALEGRREVFQRIMDYLDFTPEQLAALRGARIQEESDE